MKEIIAALIIGVIVTFTACQSKPKTEESPADSTTVISTDTTVLSTDSSTTIMTESDTTMIPDSTNK